MTSSRCHSESVYYSYGNPLPMEFGMDEEVITEPVDSSRVRDSILVTIRFRSLSERECHRGDEIAWYADGDKIVRNEYNPATAYAFDRVFGPHTNSNEVYEVAAKPVVKAAMESFWETNILLVSYHWLSKMFSALSKRKRVLIRVSYLEIYNEHKPAGYITQCGPCSSCGWL
ncbi:kinesin-like protein KIN-7D, mitochondrial isoform X1 [Glycine soja]|uniref:kinesin-like protein KIN-7D, mitochondrial isoform X1 n=1 Tax=Glycine soja TaxID=3848 RepID=UPI0010396A22|nr:kinesin-like protein KIN-7D, mitochondrial isoform X1 [Glycine soja]XP_028220862.1 kinesin-like protein KIN-7D, mitochondrial isoform X1 [Glycine soja]XP_028220863.1 kinesin-like protein KIN-7D, mitochondrial isoform X1 [Glycine soja]XP_028220864.1 kinesin-like protein KIN-7D, mitochondrial isoform X1 [Glycine soja]XP_028220865.1 kinesin-like protein KIN-7D, mitochondrial isoform X1 [Glycine soja]XP_028220867.1 kinesin-like protein KIN-7D, mitochondrial isoform X1 [Glycine soja]XP_02822086